MFSQAFPAWNRYYWISKSAPHFPESATGSFSLLHISQSTIVFLSGQPLLFYWCFRPAQTTWANPFPTMSDRVRPIPTVSDRFIFSERLIRPIPYMEGWSSANPCRPWRLSFFRATLERVHCTNIASWRWYQIFPKNHKIPGAREI